jgi:hypothetical protein
MSGLEATITGDYKGGFVVREKTTEKSLYLPFKHVDLFEVVE